MGFSRFAHLEYDKYVRKQLKEFKPIEKFKTFKDKLLIECAAECLTKEQMRRLEACQDKMIIKTKRKKSKNG